MTRYILLALLAATAVLAKDCSNKKTASKLLCYYTELTDIDSCKCTHIILPNTVEAKAIDKLRQQITAVKILVTVTEFNQGLVELLKSSKVDGVELRLNKLDGKSDIVDFIATVRSKLGGDLLVVLAVPPKAEALAKYYDFKVLNKHADLFLLQTGFLGASTNVTFHPSRLSGLWDMQNTDSVVDLVSGLGAPLSKLVITSPVQAFQFKLQSEKHTAPGSPALQVQSITRDQLCATMNNGQNWTLERDQDQAGPYIFSKDQWIAFDDATSIDIKAKYARVRGLAGLALMDLSQDGGDKCASSILDAAYTGLSRQARAPRGAVLHSLEREILETPARPLDSIQVSPYRISRVIDVEGNVHVVRQDTRTEFECSRQGYFVHPRSCGRFYRCVKFDQLSDDFSVFEFDCPAGLAFDSRVEVCVWPGSLPHASACSGSSEIAPVPRERFVCPGEPGYYADPENCRWFFACLDHGKSPLSAYEFRCPFGLVFDESRLLCEWSWLVPKCGSGFAIGSEVVYGGAGLVSLDQYSGLGVLPPTVLGGLHGPLQQPEAKVYSNVGFTAAGLANSHIGATEYQTGTASINSIGSGVAFTDAASGTHGIAGNGQQIVGYQTGTVGLNGIGSGAAFGNAAFGVHGNEQQVVGYQAGTAHLNGNGVAFTNVASGAHGSAGNEQQVVGYEAGTFGNAGQGIIGTGQQTVGYQAGTTNLNGIGHSVSYSNIASGISGNDQQRVEYQAGTANLNGLAGGAYGNYRYDGSQYIAGNSGLSIKAAQSLQNAGLLKTSGINSVASGLNYNTGSIGNLNYVQYAANAGGYGLKTNQNIGAGFVYNSQGQDGLVNGAKSQQSFVQYHNNDNSAAYGASSGLNRGSDLQQHHINEGINFNYQAGAAGTTIFNGKAIDAGNLQQEYAQISDSNAQQVNGLSYNNAAHQQNFEKTVVGTADYGAKSQQSFVQYHGQGEAVVTGYDNAKSTGSNYESGTAGNINIIGGGYSAVGVADSNIQITSNGADSNTVTHVTGSPVTVSSIPAVTSVPVPSLKVASGFQSYKGGVVANVPELQYKVQRPVGKIQFQQNARGSAGIADVSSSFVNFISSTPSTVDGGYDYPKPSVAFVEEPQKTTVYQKTTFVQQPVVVSTTSTPVVKVQPALISTYNVQKQDVSSVGYDYPKPAVRFEETPVQVTQPIGGSFSYQKQDTVHKSQGYVYEKPTVAFEELPLKTTQHVSTYSTPRPVTVVQPAVVTSYSPVSTVKPLTVVEQVQPDLQAAVSYSSFQKHDSFQGYDYPKPAVAFEERPQVQVTSYNVPSSTVRPVVVQQQPQVYVSSTPATIVQQKVAQPAVVSSFSISSHSQGGGYHYEKPAVAFEEKPAVVTYQQPQIQQTLVTTQPQIATYTYQKPAVSTYTYQDVVKQSTSSGYSYPKPAITFEETPASVTRLNYQPAVVSSYSYTAPSTPRPTIVKQTPVVASYSYTAPSTPAPAVLIQKEAPVVSTYTYSAPSTVKPAVVIQQQPVVSTFTYATTPKPQVLIQKQPAVVSSYSYTAPSPQRPAVQEVEFKGYDYPKPAVQFVEQPVVSYENQQPIEEVPFVAKKAYVTGGHSYQYNQQFNTGAAVEVQQKPAVVVENYQAPVQQEIVVSSTPQYEYKQQYSNVDAGYVYEKPSAQFVEERVVVTTPKYQEQKYSVDSGYVYEKPTVRFEEKPIQYQSPVVYDNVVKVTTSRPIVDYSYVQSTPRPTFATIINKVAQVQPTTEKEYYYYDNRVSSTPRSVIQTYTTSSPVVESITTSRPIVKYSFSSLDDQYSSTAVPPTANVIVEEYAAPVEITSPRREYLPVRSRVRVTTPTEAYAEVTTPSRDYLPVRSRVRVTTNPPTESYVDVTTPSREYLPVKSRVRLTTTPVPATPTRTYLPVDEEVVVTRRPAKVVKVIRPNKVKTIVKNNDFHPLLSAKLGAQCTCVSNTVKLRKKPVRIIIEDDNDDDDDDGYVVDQNNNDGVIVENYQFEPEKVIDITPTPEVFIKSTTNEIIPAPTPLYTVKKRVRVRPATQVYKAPVTEAVEIFTKKIESEEAPSDREIAKAVRTGLKLVKQAAKEGAREALAGKDFDRYGPGGLRSRTETLQGTIDCQRAGLFRHPTQCNKFYACRWDCTKNRYTLHVFNCPVHLTFDNNLGACNWPSQGPACLEDTLLPND